MKTKLTFILMSLLTFFGSFIGTDLIREFRYINTKVFDAKSSDYYLLTNLLNEKVCVLIFHSTTCPYNLAYEQKIDKLDDTFKSDSINFIYINCNSLENNTKSTPQKTKDFISKRPNFYLLDEDEQLENLFEIKKNGTIIVCRHETDKGISVFYKGPVDDGPQLENVANRFLELAIFNATKGIKTKINTIQTGCRITNH